ncbi:class I SAM-dependent methyltransferase [Oceanospirillaceae bacterium]|nr:class I SAM-dependent methyltransferase [Oceanospirillaceae bacterium]
MKVEIGAEVVPMSDSYSDVPATDLVRVPLLDLVLNAENMASGNESVGVSLGQNCFHHLLHPVQFFNELKGVLAAGGK